MNIFRALLTRILRACSICHTQSHQTESEGGYLGSIFPQRLSAKLS